MTKETDHAEKILPALTKLKPSQQVAAPEKHAKSLPPPLPRKGCPGKRIHAECRNRAYKRIEQKTYIGSSRYVRCDASARAAEGTVRVGGSVRGSRSSMYPVTAGVYTGARCVYHSHHPGAQQQQQPNQRARGTPMLRAHAEPTADGSQHTYESKAPACVRSHSSPCVTCPHDSCSSTENRGTVAQNCCCCDTADEYTSASSPEQLQKAHSFAAIKHSSTVEKLASSSVDPDGANELCQRIEGGIHSGHGLELQTQGLGGAYLLRDASGEPVALWKPREEEAFAPRNPKGFVGRSLGDEGYSGSIRVGEACFREAAAYIIDGGDFAGVPLTVMARMRTAQWPKEDGQSNPSEYMVGSLQRFVKNDGDCSELGTSLLPARQIKRIGLLDLAIYNTDRHTMNLLQSGFNNFSRGSASGGISLTPIDHGNALPEKMEAVFLEWLHWPQAKVPFEEDEIEWVKGLDYSALEHKLRSEIPNLRTGSLRLLWVTVTVLRETVLRYKMNLAQLGHFFSRPLTGKSETNSPLEMACYSALQDAQITSMPSCSSHYDSDVEETLQFSLEEEEESSSSSIDIAGLHSSGASEEVTPVRLPASPPAVASSYTGHDMFPRKHAVVEDMKRSDDDNSTEEDNLVTVDLTQLSQEQFHAFQEAFAQTWLPAYLNAQFTAHQPEDTPANGVMATSCPVNWNKRTTSGSMRV